MTRYRQNAPRRIGVLALIGLGKPVVLKDAAHVDDVASAIRSQELTRSFNQRFQCDINTGKLIDSRMVRVAPPRTHSRALLWL